MSPAEMGERLLLSQKIRRLVNIGASATFCSLPMYLLLLKYKVPIEQVERVTPVHREFLDTAYQAQELLVSGPRVPRTGGVILARVKTRAEVGELIQADPFYSENIELITR